MCKKGKILKEKRIYGHFVREIPESTDSKKA